MDLSEIPNRPHNEHGAAPGSLGALRDGKTTVREATGPGHVFDNITALDRVHLGNAYGDQHIHYHAVPISQPMANLEETLKPQSLLDALYFDQMDFRSSTVAAAHSNTCQWLFDTSQYKRWRDRHLLLEHSGFLWIKGKPGAGKSTVMKYASEQAKTACRDEMTVTFFFNARGAALGKSTEGMYRCLLHQMADRVPQLPSMVETKARRSYDAQGWPLEKLKAMFREAAFHISRETRLSFYIDALDEGDDEDQVRDMADLFYETAQKALSDGNPFYVCLASRHYPKISVRSSEELRLEDHNGHHNDIAGYVHNKLRLGNGQLEEELATEILHKSSGVFLWVVLVVAILNKEGDRGNQHLLRAQLQRIPTGLFDILEEIRYQDASDERFLPAIRWVLFSCVPLKAEELYYAILVSTGQLTTESIFWNRQIIDARVINDFILSSSKGLVEIGGEDLEGTSNLAGSPEAEMSLARVARLGGKVQFIHEVVREYFLEHGLTKLDPEALDHPIATSHQCLSRCCQSYVRLAYPDLTRKVERSSNPDRELSQIVKKSFPFLDYSLKMALTHATLATQMGRRIVGLAENFPWDQWIFHKRTDAHRRMYTWLHLITYERWPLLVKDELKLLEGRTKHSRRGKEEFQSMLDARSEGLGSALHIAAAQKTQPGSSFEQLLDSGAGVNTMCKDIGSPLHSAVKSVNLHATRSLLERGANVNASCGQFGNVLDCAVQDSFSSLLNVLDDHISAEEERIRLDIIRILLEYGANAQNQGINAALRDVQHGKFSLHVIEVLLRNEADIKSADWLLHTAIMDRNSNMVELLLQEGADFRRCIGEYGDAVQTASITNDWKMMKILSNFGADVDPEDFSIGGPYSDPSIAQSNSDSLADEEITRVSDYLMRMRKNYEAKRITRRVQRAAFERSKTARLLPSLA